MRYSELVQNTPPIVLPTTETIVTYSSPIGEIYISEQPSLLVSNGTTGLRTWEASLLLAEWILRQDIRGKNLVELGAGTGLVGILAARMGAEVTSTDGSEAVAMNLHANFDRNGAIGDVRVFRWGEDDEILHRKWDLIVAADVTYDDETCSSLAETYTLGLRRGGIGVLAATVRNENTLKAFERECGNSVFWKC